MSTPQHTVAVTMAHQWVIQRPFVYRYMDKPFVDAFFKDGSLRLSSFAHFSKHSDEQRKDTQEGTATVSNFDKVNKQTFFARIGKGQDAYVLCGATRYSRKIATAFKADSGFRINDPTSFAGAIAHVLPGFMHGIEGPCIYRSSKVIRRTCEFKMEDMKSDPGGKNFDMGKMFQVASQTAGEDMLFLKLKKYEAQSEYRLIWYTSFPSDDFIDIKCPEAIKFCTRFDDIEE